MSTAKYEVVDDVLKYTTKRGKTIEIDLDIPPDVFAKATADEAVTEEQQFAAVKEWLGDDIEAAFNEMGALERTRFYRTFFAEWQKAAELPLGESLSSSTS